MTYLCLLCPTCKPSVTTVLRKTPRSPNCSEHVQVNWGQIRESLARTSIYDYTWDTGKIAGEGFYNANYRAGEAGVPGGATLPRNPVQGQTSWVTVRLRVDQVTNKIYVLTAFPLGRIGI
jgi:hypothetical protein